MHGSGPRAAMVRLYRVVITFASSAASLESMVRLYGEAFTIAIQSFSPAMVSVYGDSLALQFGSTGGYGETLQGSHHHRAAPC